MIGIVREELNQSIENQPKSSAQVSKASSPKDSATQEFDATDSQDQPKSPTQEFNATDSQDQPKSPTKASSPKDSAVTEKNEALVEGMVREVAQDIFEKKEHNDPIDELSDLTKKTKIDSQTTSENDSIIVEQKRKLIYHRYS